MLTAEQVEARFDGIGGSEAAIVAALPDARMTRRELYHIKRKELEPSEPDPLLAWLGHAIEPIVAAWYAEQEGVKVRATTKTRRHKDLPYMIAHPDFTVTGKKKGVEVKMRVSGEGWGPPGTDQVPDDVLLQAEHYLAVTGFETWDVAALLSGREIRTYTIPRDQRIIDVLVDTQGAFMEDVKAGNPPEIDLDHATAAKLLERLHPGTDGKVMELGAGAMSWHDVISQAKVKRAEYDKAIDIAKAHLLDLMGDAAVGLLPDGGAYHRKEIHRQGYSVDATQYTTLSYKRGPK